MASKKQARKQVKAKTEIKIKLTDVKGKRAANNRSKSPDRASSGSDYPEGPFGGGKVTDKGKKR